MEKDDLIDLSAAHFTPFMCGMGEILSPKWVQTMPIIGPQNAQYCAQNTPEIPILSKGQAKSTYTQAKPTYNRYTYQPCTIVLICMQIQG